MADELRKRREKKQGESALQRILSYARGLRQLPGRDNFDVQRKQLQDEVKDSVLQLFAFMGQPERVQLRLDDGRVLIISVVKESD